ncbi:hypothetical protein K491DRAFT_85435 [Lophiostoma macrostomum CBS 122681]|uniref:Uncharacterized protein n=1 Tax=Lophiostoma macrostomum CBS 122681 TaxID=1314788 RepID=A0A6A6SVT4_9PLEO|nr:hypothetical protein K491DRAFT_85435 [Lophiostoma macrostomum CBS 122681]
MGLRGRERWRADAAATGARRRSLARTSRDRWTRSRRGRGEVQTRSRACPAPACAWRTRVRWLWRSLRSRTRHAGLPSQQRAPCTFQENLGECRVSRCGKSLDNCQMPMQVPQRAKHLLCGAENVAAPGRCPLYLPTATPDAPVRARWGPLDHRR